MISEAQQDGAALYALELLDADEAAAFERAAAADGELRTLADEFREVAATLARTDVRSVAPPASVRERVLARVAAEASSPAAGKVVAMPSWRTTRLPWAAAAVLAFGCGILGLVSWRQAKYGRFESETRADAYLQLFDATRRAQGAEDALAAERNNSLARVGYCALEPVPAAQATGPRAAVLWDAASRRGRLQLNKLPPPGAGKDYQLWTVEAGHPQPISAGVVRVGADGTAAVDFQPNADDDAGAAVAAFALSVERAGGAAHNEGPILFLGKLAP